MTLQEVFNRVRIYTRDTTGSIFPETTIEVFAQESFDRFTIIPEFATLLYPLTKTTQISMIPIHFQYLIALYSASRCLLQDEQDYKAGTLMNEFEMKMDELLNLIEIGQITIKDVNGVPVKITNSNDYVVNEYFDETISDEDIFGTIDV